MGFEAAGCRGTQCGRLLTGRHGSLAPCFADDDDNDDGDDDDVGVKRGCGDTRLSRLPPSASAYRDSWGTEENKRSYGREAVEGMGAHVSFMDPDAAAGLDNIVFPWAMLSTCFVFSCKGLNST
ncbi:hypothetical protein IAQ61_009341 [Plenodomus lingam]|uniref:Predicted protein n=1 Tax=Leptosphaeria maculans (strain JN3 / isolate v23.1.3 / race Av1-4-5-6-7-8) TaxID=985895 RepID=E4ZTU6_LEPMJ|nr:predicted protein [Plenodomus lingam JN3]KAH9863066.1 hypothetical protein IAQ61_009341 [Plenodomus lingam]CBX94656.1 predicted protein [Plenodomus lingam JN3]